VFAGWAKEWNAAEYQFPPFLPAVELNKMDYFRSFPHLVTFPVTLNPQQQNLQRFTDTEPYHPETGIRLTERSAIQDALTPAACYHFYVLLQGKQLPEASYFTTRATCFRRESHYQPLQRQWSFSMREIVCIGRMERVRSFLEQMRIRIDGFLRSIRLPVDWTEAIDPFFNPRSNPKYLSQLLDPVKTEIVFENQLAIGSLNFHRNYFGDTFRIQCDGKEAFSGCVAFGIERWMYAFVSCFGNQETDWPL